MTSSSLAAACARHRLVSLRRALALCAGLLGLGSSASAQFAELRFQQLSGAQNLSQTTVTALVEDRQGLLWIATQDGLDRFDGYEIAVFKHDPRDPGSLSHNNVLDLYQDRAGAIWVVTFARGVINRYDPASGSFRRYRHDPDDPLTLRDATFRAGALHDDGHGRLWIGCDGGGIDLLDIATGEVTRLSHDPEREASLAPGVVTAIVEDRRGELWIALDGGGVDRAIRRANGAFDFAHHRHDPARDDSLSSDRATAILEDGSGGLWVGTVAGLDRYRPESDGFDRFDHGGPHSPPPSRDTIRAVGANLRQPMLEDRSGALWLATARGLSRFDPRTGLFRDFELSGAGPGFGDDLVSLMLADRSGQFWVGTQGNGLYLYRPASDDFVPVRSNPAHVESLGSDFLTVGLETRSGLLWFGTTDAGAFKYSRERNAIRYYAQDPSDPHGLVDDMVFALLEDSAGELWVGTMTGGLHRLDPGRTRVLERYASLPGDRHDIGSDFVRALLEDRKGRFWVGTVGAGLVEIDRAHGEVVRRLRHDPDDPTSLSQDEVRSIYEDRRGRIWVATAFGWNELDPASGRFTRHHSEPGNPRSLPNESTRFTFEDRAGRIWVGTDMGLARFDPVSGEFTSYRVEPGRTDGLSNDNLMDLYEDESGRYWVATYGGGLNLLDPETGRARVFTSADGLPNDSLYSVLPDDDGYIWMSTNQGISRLDPRSLEFENFDVGDGLQGSEFNGRAFTRTRRGELLFGGVHGFNAFFPRDIRPNTYVPPVIFTGIRRMGQPVRPDGDDEGIPEVVLGPREKLIAFEFAALDFSHPEKNRYSYRLEGFDRQWVDAGTNRTAQYTNLDPGSYLFRVRGSNGDGVWNDQGAAVRVVVMPPIWRRWWAYAAYSLLLGGMVVGFVHIKNSRHAAELEQQRREAEEERKTRELEQARSLQLSMIPERPPAHPDYEIATYIGTATEVGGDYFDFFPQEDGSLVLAVGDATGHGLPAGMMVGMTRAAIHALGGGAPSEILRELNRVIRRVHPERLNMALSLARMSNGNFGISSAGMPPAFVVRAESGAVEEVLLPGLPLGALESASYLESTRSLGSGDLLVLISDGLPELRDADGRVLGYPAVEACLRSCGRKSAEEVVGALVAAGEAWRGDRPPDDDVTLVAIRHR